MDKCDATAVNPDFLIHNLFPAFPFYAEALWEIAREEGSGEGSVVEEGRRGAVAEFGGGRKRKKRKASLGNERSQSSAHVLVQMKSGGSSSCVASITRMRGLAQQFVVQSFLCSTQVTGKAESQEILVRKKPRPLLDRKQTLYSTWILLGRPADYE